jgi:hypothetical protein
MRRDRESGSESFLGRGEMRNGATIGWWSTIFLCAAGALAAPDPCLLTVAEARELGGTDTSQAGGSATTCPYLASDSSPRLSISVLPAGGAEGQAKLGQLADRELFTERKNGRARTWVAADKLEGWVLSGEVLASVSAAGEWSSKRRRRLELTVYKISEKLR